MVEKFAGVFVGLGFFLVGLITLILPAEVRRWKDRHNERFAPFYRKNTLWDGHEGLVHFLYRLAGGLIAGIGFVMLFESLRPH